MLDQPFAFEKASPKKEKPEKSEANPADAGNDKTNHAETDRSDAAPRVSAAPAKTGKIRGLKTKPKILLGICIPLILSVVLGVISYYSIKNIIGIHQGIEQAQTALGDSA